VVGACVDDFLREVGCDVDVLWRAVAGFAFDGVGFGVGRGAGDADTVGDGNASAMPSVVGAAT
jgi:hypothetical protein